MGFLKPRKLDKSRIVARVAAAPAAPDSVHVAPLAYGFFRLERMRQARVAARRKLGG